MSILDQIIAQGNHRHGYRPNMVTCSDGFECSVLAGPGVYATPRPALAMPGEGVAPPDMLSAVASDYPGPYTAVEVGFPTERPEPWTEWAGYAEDESEPTDTVYTYVPVTMVRDLIDSHGGEAS